MKPSRYVIDLQYSVHNASDRSLDVLLRPPYFRWSPETGSDRRYSVDGKPLEVRGSANRTTLQAGEHGSSSRRASGRWARDVEGKLVLQVAENKLPTCTVQPETIGSSGLCTRDARTDGQDEVVSDWTVGGEIAKPSRQTGLTIPGKGKETV